MGRNSIKGDPIELRHNKSATIAIQSRSEGLIIGGNNAFPEQPVPLEAIRAGKREIPFDHNAQVGPV